MKFAWSLGMVEDAARVGNPAQLWKILAEYAATVVGPNDTVAMKFLSDPSLSTQTYLATVSAVLTVRAALNWEAEGYDGVMLAGSIDPGLDEARSVIPEMPVVGVTEAAVALSGFIGRRAGIVTIGGGTDRFSYVRMIEGIITKYGCRARLLDHRPVRPLRESYAEGYRIYSRAIEGDGAAFLASFDAVASELTADGADVIICGNQLFGPMLHHLGRRACTPEGVPVLCNVAAGLTSLQTLASMRKNLGLKKSNSGVFHPPVKELLRDASNWLQHS
jgi:Asp/Glu/hydantoin racemase